MATDAVNRIKANPIYRELKQKRSSFSWVLTALTLIVYYGYILIIAFNKEFLAVKTGAGVMTMGIPIGLGVIIFTIAITGLYVYRANGEFDEMSDRLMKEEALK
ncbi:MAG: DUF485 domain-containing protein [Rhodocyclaceae bacterium]|nr:DUF485 domain-containing protein [Rhodocyclaceae bacterium]